ncbi:MAG: hypothetical protein U9R19_07690 [Bacteroidota bacterium]|nr:hypothetical protein [Bacteroidota bacterium]
MATLTKQDILDLLEHQAIEFNKRQKEADIRQKEADIRQKEAEVRQKEAEIRQKEADARQKAFDKGMDELRKEVGGIGKSNGAIAEDFFYSGLSNSMKLANMEFDYVDRNLQRKRNNLQAEYDIVLYNNYKVAIVEVKYNFKISQLRTFYKDKIKNFKILFPQYKQYVVYGVVAGLTFEKGFFEEAQSYGFYVLTQDNDRIQILNSNDFVPNEIK